MTEPEAVEPDAIVRTALQLLPVPPHGEGFWAALEASLDAEPVPSAEVSSGAAPVLTATGAPAGAGGPVVELVLDPGLALVPPGVRRRSNVVLTAVAVVAAVVVVIAGTTLVRDRSGSGTDATEVADAPEDGSGTMASSTSQATVVSISDGLPTDAVLGWVSALGSGDMDAAWAAMGPASHDHFGSRSAFEAERSGLAEGYGAWSSTTPDDVYVTPVASSGDGQLVVVTLVGTLEQEGMRQHRADAFPVRIVDGVATVEPFSFAGELEIVVPEVVPSGGTRPVVHVDDDLVVVVPRGVAAPTIRLDDGEPLVCGKAAGTELTELDGTPGQRCSYHPDGGIHAGDRVLTVAFLSPDGEEISAESVLFEAA